MLQNSYLENFKLSKSEGKKFLDFSTENSLAREFRLD